MQFWIANILHDDLGKHFEAMVGVAPIMYLGNIKSVWVELAIAVKF
jgi:hypothetical protein